MIDWSCTSPVASVRSCPKWAASARLPYRPCGSESFVTTSASSTMTAIATPVGIAFTPPAVVSSAATRVIRLPVWSTAENSSL